LEDADVRRLRVVLADDHKVVAEAIARLLADHFELVAITNTGRELLQSVADHRPDVVVSDVYMPELSGLEALRQLRANGITTRFVFLTMQVDAGLAAEVFRAGASALVSKEDATDELIQAIAQASEGQMYLTPSIGKELIDILAHAREPSEEAVLSKRQREILQLLAEGKSVKDCAGLLGISPRTVESHKYEMMEILDIKTPTDLVRWALRLNLISPRLMGDEKSPNY
jgi:DNA-binding NarL/FixJ family response regulator